MSKDKRIKERIDDLQFLLRDIEVDIVTCRIFGEEKMEAICKVSCEHYKICNRIFEDENKETLGHIGD